MEDHFQEVLAKTRRKEAAFKYFKPSSRPQSRAQQSDYSNIRRMQMLALASPRSKVDKTTPRPLTNQAAARTHYNLKSLRTKPNRQESDGLELSPKTVTGLQVRAETAWADERSIAELSPVTPGSKPSQGFSSCSDKLAVARRLDQDLKETERPKCVLNDADMPPVAETDHFTRRCLCYLCTCTEHDCPGNKMLGRQTSATAFKTVYRKEYRRKFAANYREARNLLEKHRANTLPMELRTTHQTEFLPFKVSPVEPVKYDSPQVNLRFSGRSLYTSEFPNWGPNFIEHERQCYLPYRGQGVKIDPRTTYSTEFAHKGLKDKQGEDKRGLKGLQTGDSNDEQGKGRDDHDLKSQQGARGLTGAGETSGKEAFTNRTASSNLKTSPISVSTHFYGETTAKASFSHSSLGMSTYNYATRQDYSPSVCTSGHFTTTYTSDFTSKSPYKMWPKRSNS
jgi:hypothetical protein